MSLLLTALLALAPQAAELECQFEVTPQEAQIGQPLECRLVVEHPLGSTLNLDAESLIPDDSWIVLEDLQTLPERVDGVQRVTASWTIASLESGSRRVGAPATMCEVNGEQLSCGERKLAVTIAAALAPEEDAPRPPARPPLPAQGEEARYVSPAWFLLLPGGLLLAVLLVRLARRKRPMPESVLPPARERLAALDLALPAEDYCAQLRTLLRGAVDERARTDRRGLTDDEWLDVSSAPPETEARLRALLATCEAVRFGGEQPTRWALESLRDEALGVLPVEEVAA